MHDQNGTFSKHTTSTNIDYSFYLIADEQVCAPRSIVQAVAMVIDHGVTCVQLRMKHRSTEEMLAVGKPLATLLRSKKIPLIINDNVEVALALDAEGVHVGQSDLPCSLVRQQVGKQKIVGLSIENQEQAQRCRDFDCDYFGVGPIFPTKSKLDAAPPLGLSQLKAIIRLLPKPVVAIGGIYRQNILSVLQTNVAGVVVASAIFSTLNPGEAAQTFAQYILEAKSC
jgi:thiamine-phosphate pyrophosphorylase